MIQIYRQWLKKLSEKSINKHREKVMRNVCEKKIDAFLVTNQADLFYITGISLDGYWILVTRNDIKAVSPQILYWQLRALIRGVDVICGKSMLKTSAEQVKKHKIKSIGLDSNSVSLDLRKRMEKELPGVSWIKMPDFIREVRQVKFDEEIEAIRESCKLALRVFKQVKADIKPGRTEKNINDKIRYYFDRNSAESCFDPIVAAGKNSMYPHHLSSDNVIKKDDTVTVDLGCKCGGYCSDLTRTVFLGKGNRKLKKVYDVVKMAKEKVIDEIKPGVPASALDAIARKIIRKHGYGKYFIHSTGHGVGIEVHELPRLSPTCKTKLEPGMVITVEPGVYIPDVGGIRIEDTVLVTDTGCEILTKGH